MKVDNEQQRQQLLNCIRSASITGCYIEILPIITDISHLIKTVEEAEIEEKEEVV